MQTIYKGKLFNKRSTITLIDGAHNVDGAMAINNHLKNSYWFSRLLSKLIRQDAIVKRFLESENVSNIKSLRISLYQYSFSNNNQINWWQIDTSNSPSIIIELK